MALRIEIIAAGLFIGATGTLFGVRKIVQGIIAFEEGMESLPPAIDPRTLDQRYPMQYSKPVGIEKKLNRRSLSKE